MEPMRNGLNAGEKETHKGRLFQFKSGATQLILEITFRSGGAAGGKRVAGTTELCSTQALFMPAELSWHQALIGKQMGPSMLPFLCLGTHLGC